MGDYSCKIERMANGYEVEISDPKIVERNRDPKVAGWRDPKVCYGFKTVDEVLTFLKNNLDKALPAEDYETTFNVAVAKSRD